MGDNFAPSLAHLLVSEGGWSGDPKDPGGATNEGVTQHQYDVFRLSRGQATRSVRFIDQNEVEAIYRGLYWKAVRGDDLPSGVDYCTFDFAVHSGPHRAACALQEAVGATADGQIGPSTMAAVRSADPRRIISLISSERLAYLERLPTWPHFGLGWGRRVASVEQVARGMAA